MKLRIAVCDDEQAELSFLSDLASRWAAERGHAAFVRAFENAEAFLFDYTDGERFDILLLDIQMGERGMDGVALAKKLRAPEAGGGMGDEKLQIVFVTGFPDFMAQGYEVSALHYLMKPVEEERLRSVLDRALPRLEKQEKSLLVKAGSDILRVEARDILYAEAFAHSTVVAAKSGSFEVRQTIGELEEELGEGFFRCHRSYLVALGAVARITATDVILDGGKAVPLSRRLYKEANRAFIRYYRGEGE